VDNCTIDEVVANGALSNIQESTNQVMNWANDNKVSGKSKENKAHAAEQFFPIFS
jgi:hypothetical protein